MDRGAVSSLVRDTLAGYCYEPPPAGSTVGVPCLAEKVYGYVEKLKEALVEPYLQRFELRETYEQVVQPEPRYAEFWVVAVVGSYLQWYNPATGEFGLGQRFQDSPTPVSIGVRGDLVGVFCAM
jgi:hypothetical protein